MMLATMAGAMCAGAVAQSGVLYAPGRTIDDQGIVLRSWGSGAASQTDEAAYEGIYSVRVSTRNFFQGGILNFANTPDLATLYPDKNNLLRLTFRVADLNLTLGGGGGKGDAQGGAIGGLAGGGGGVAGTAGGKGGGRGAAQGGGQSEKAALKELRFVITTTDGKRSEAYVPIDTSSSGDRGWRTTAIPLQAIAGFDKTNKIVSSVALAGDATAVFYVGDLRVINDSTPISGEPNVTKLNLALGDEVQLWAYGYGGASVLTYKWDFDSKDGIQVDAESQVVKRKFRKPGKYTITVTIADKYGLKKPYTTTIDVTVNP
ncbi:MAG: PKD domain-containing protein [Fimbriimonadaceae bacterium]|nr:PKD domain-containing protein [Chthonomonadaceae bacterium]MCO5296116.1 PKD domain-containing protein [Fimbriimonadaceae bacterium]